MTRRQRDPARRPAAASLVCVISLGAFGAMAVGTGCERNEPRRVEHADGPAKPKVATPVDRLAPGELEPSDELAFGLPIPKGMRVVRRFDDATHAKGRIDHDELVEYLKRRLSTSHVTYKLDKVVFPEVQLRDAPSNEAGDEADGEAPPKTLQIEVWADRDMTWMRVKDTTVPPLVEGLTEAERWRRAGMHPDGSPLDPDALK